MSLPPANHPGRGAVILLTALCSLLVGCDERGGSSDEPAVVGSFGRTGSGDGEFMYPRAIDICPDGSIWVVDKTGRVQHLAAGKGAKDMGGEFLGAFRMPLIEAGKPTGLTVGPDGNIYMADTHYHRVMVFSPSGTLVRQFGKFGQGPGCFIYPTDVAFIEDGPRRRILVSEYGGNDRISVFEEDASGGIRFVRSFGAPGSGAGELSRPAALAVDHRRRRLYVADACNHRVAIYDLDCNLVGYIGSPGTQAGQLRYPYGLALLADGSLAVCEFGNNRLQIFSPEGKSLRTCGKAGREPGQLAYPWGLVVDKHNRACVVDAGNNRVQAWQL